MLGCAAPSEAPAAKTGADRMEWELSSSSTSPMLAVLPRYTSGRLGRMLDMGVPVSSVLMSEAMFSSSSGGFTTTTPCFGPSRQCWLRCAVQEY